jgi:hypothetical protein
MSLQLNPGELKVLQYPMPIKAEKIELKLNGTKVPAARTFGRGKAYTYFEAHGASFYVPGHLTTETDYTVAFPENFAPKTLKVTRTVVKKAKTPKEPKPTNGEAAPVVAAPAAADAETPAPFGKKAKR